MLKTFVLLTLISANALADSWQPGRDFEQVSVWPKGLKVLTSGAIRSAQADSAGPVTNVTTPTYTVYRPKSNSSGTSIIVLPGGSYRTLTMDKEGTEICDWLNSKGITCVLLKYRVPFSGCYWDELAGRHITPKVPMALQDVQRTISTVRFHAKKYGLDPRKIGVMGFSAGGNLAVRSSTEFKRRTYKPVDEIDNVDCRPDFAIPVSAGHMTMEHKNKKPREVAAKELNTDIVISSEIPPTILIHTKDDLQNPVYYSEIYEKELKKADVEVVIKIYENGGHGFGLRKSGKDSDRWANDVIDWLKKRKLI